MEEQLMKMVRDDIGTNAPIFPERIDFEVLLRNKFET
jgi:hypothetical protein